MKIKRMISAGLIFSLLFSLSLMVTASAGPVQGELFLLSETESDFLSDIGVNVAGVVSVSYARTSVENSSARAAAE